ncbi:MAG: histidine kinase dimerization/phosphoacceptor domain -containing protein [Candidatus Methylomirabilales bacterium]
MEKSPVHQEIDSVSQRLLEDLRHGVGASPVQDVVVEILRGLSNSLHELQVAAKDLREQNEELTATRRAVGAERQRYQEFFEFAPDGYLVTDAEGTIREANRAAAALLTAHQDHLIGERLVTFVAERDRRTFQSQLARLPELRQVWNWEVRFQPLKGVPFLAAISAAAVGDPQSKLATLRWLVRDITERKRSESRLNAQFAVTRVLAEAATLRDATPRLLQAICEGLGCELGELWLVDLTAKVLRWGGMWYAPSLDGAEFEAISRKSTFAPGTDLPGRVWVGRRAAWIPDVLVDTEFIRAPIAAKIGLHAALAFPIEAEDELTGVIVLYTRETRQPDPEVLKMGADIGGRIGQFTERRRAEEALRRAHDELELRVHERTAELAHANEALQTEIAERERAAEANALLLRELNHRVRNNLATIVGLLSMELARKKRWTAEEALKACIDRVQSLAAIHDLLAQDDFRELDLKKLVEEVAKAVVRGIGWDENVKITVDAPALRLPPKWLGSLALAANELITNAIIHAFLARDTGLIHVQVTEEEKEIRLSVKDNGIGIPTTNEGEWRRGVGLDIVASLVETDLQGQFQLRNDRGTVATIRFPKPKLAGR